MSWAEVKHAINSTVGTSEFKSLDKMIMGNWHLVESNNVYLTETPSYSSTAGTYALSNSFKMKASGAAKVRLLTAYATSVTCDFEIYKNGQLYKSSSRQGDGNNTNISLTVSISFETDDIFTFKLIRTIGVSAVSSISDISLLCDAVYAPRLVESL